jgi:hypothetical protein
MMLFLMVIKFSSTQDKDFETRKGHILPAIKNVKGKYCLLVHLRIILIFEYL